MQKATGKITDLVGIFCWTLIVEMGNNLDTGKHYPPFIFFRNTQKVKSIFSYKRMCKTHWFSTKLSAEDKNICSVLLPQSKHREIGPAPSSSVITDNVCSWQYHHYKLYYCIWYFTRCLAGECSDTAERIVLPRVSWIFTGFQYNLTC